MKSRDAIILLAVIFLASTIVLYAPVAQLIRDLATVPAIGALVGALFVILRDQIAHERALFLQQLQASSELGTTSHMATVAFDKHVAFSEEYLTATTEAFSTLARKGPVQDALDLATKLANIRTRWALWITPDLNPKLADDFESPLYDIGLEMQIAGSGPPQTEDARCARSNAVKAYKKLLGIDPNVEPAQRQRALDRTVSTLQELLGTTELTQMRSRLVKKSALTLQNPDSPATF